MANTNQYTPSLPWNRVGNHVVDVGSRTICVTYSGKSDQREADAERAERAERIFRCVNAHDSLVAALIRLCKTFPTDDDMARAGWTEDEINEACDAYDAARALVSPAPQES